MAEEPGLSTRSGSDEMHKALVAKADEFVARADRAIFKWTHQDKCDALRLIRDLAAVRSERGLLTDLCNWGISHKASCPPPASNFQKGKQCKCGRDALLHRLRVAIGRAQPAERPE